MIQSPKYTLLVGVILALAVSQVSAQKRAALEPTAWNLARSFAASPNANPNGQWSYWVGESGNRAFDNNYLLQAYTDNCTPYPQVEVYAGARCFVDPQTPSLHFGHRKDTLETMVHPGANRQVVIKWTSPMRGSISVLGNVRDRNGLCGDGVAWSLWVKNRKVAEGSSNNRDVSQVAAVNAPINRNDAVYLVIDGKKSDHCDLTALDLSITGWPL